MTALLTGFRTRVLDIVCNGRGADGSLGAQAQNRSIAANRYRPSANNAPLESLGAESFDRAVRVAPASIGDEPFANNELSSAQLRVMSVFIEVGYAQGATPAYIDAKGSEVAATVQYTARERAISDAEMIKRALTFPELYQASGDDPEIVVITRNGRSEVTEMADRVVCRTVYDVTLQLNATTAYNG